MEKAHPLVHKNRDRNKRALTENLDNRHTITVQKSKMLSLSLFIELDRMAH